MSPAPLDFGRKLAGNAISLAEVLKVLTLSTLLELVLYRTFSRIGIFIPKSGAALGAYTAISQLGFIVFNFSALLVFAALLPIAYLYVRQERGYKKILPIASILLLLLLGAALLMTSNQLLVLSYYIISSAVIILLSFRCFQILWRRGRIFIALLTASFLSYRYYVSSHIIYLLFGKTSVPFFAMGVSVAGELLLTLSGIAVFFAYSEAPRISWSDKKPLAVASLIAAAFILAGLANPSMTSIFTMWTLGYSLSYPLPLYALALWLFLFTAVKCISEEERRYTGYGLIFLFAAGYAHKLTYQHLLAVLGMLLAAKPKAD